LIVSASARTRDSANTKDIAVRNLQRTLRIGGAPFPGDEFALLTNDINCSFCHLQVDNMRRVYADVTDTASRFKRVKLGALSGINFNPESHKNDTLIAGTVYSRGTNAPAAGSDVYFAPWASAADTGLLKAGTNNSIGASVAACWGCRLFTCNQFYRSTGIKCSRQWCYHPFW
jgi:hypothetical protein